MTFITEVGVSYAEHMNDETAEVNSSSHKCYQAFSFPGESLGTKLLVYIIVDMISGYANYTYIVG